MKCNSVLVALCVSLSNLVYSVDEQAFQLRTNYIYSEDVYNKTTFADKITDIALQELGEYLKAKGETKVPIPPVEMHYGSIHFVTSEGAFTNPATITRRGESIITTQGFTNMTVSVDVGFSLMNVHFDKYTTTLLNLIQESGKIDIIIGRNSIFLEIFIDYLPHCTVTLKKVQMKEFSDFNVDLTGLGILDYLTDRIVEWVLESYSTSFSETVESVIRSKLKEEIGRTGFCKYKDI